MILNIGTISQRLSKGIVTVKFKNSQKVLITDAEKIKFIYLNPNEIMSITVSE